MLGAERLARHYCVVAAMPCSYSGRRQIELNRAPHSSLSLEEIDAHAERRWLDGHPQSGVRGLTGRLHRPKQHSEGATLLGRELQAADLFRSAALLPAHDQIAGARNEGLFKSPQRTVAYTGRSPDDENPLQDRTMSRQSRRKRCERRTDPDCEAGHGSAGERCHDRQQECQLTNTKPGRENFYQAVPRTTSDRQAFIE